MINPKVEESELEFGVLTLATPNDWHKALGLAYSIRNCSPDVPLAVAASPRVLRRLAHVYDLLLPEREELHGFEHKVYLDSYSPFRRTLFIDADVLVLKNIEVLASAWRGREYVARGGYACHGQSTFGLDRQRIGRLLNKDRIVNIEGAGHAYFEKPDCRFVFERAREIVADYDKFCPGAKVADEDVMAIVMTELDIKPASDESLVGFLGGIARRTLSIDLQKGHCNYVDQEGITKSPTMLHFAAKQTPFKYHALMRRLTSRLGEEMAVPWFAFALRDWAQVQVLWRCGKLKSGVAKMAASILGLK